MQETAVHIIGWHFLASRQASQCPRDYLPILNQVELHLLSVATM